MSSPTDSTHSMDSFKQPGEFLWPSLGVRLRLRRRAATLETCRHRELAVKLVRRGGPAAGPQTNGESVLSANAQRPHSPSPPPRRALSRATAPGRTSAACTASSPRTRTRRTRPTRSSARWRATTRLRRPATRLRLPNPPYAPHTPPLPCNSAVSSTSTHDVFTTCPRYAS